MVNFRGLHTNLSNLEQFIGVPADDAALESAPAPFGDTRHDLCRTGSVLCSAIHCASQDDIP